MNKFLFAVLLCGMCACGEKDQKKEFTFFAGEIVNPTTDKIVLYKGEKAIDSAYLDDANRFSMRLDSLQEGLYHFFHRPEHQYVYFAKGDSLQIRLNTVAFDESLVFSGSGEDINNFLINLFLEDEKDEVLILEDFIHQEPQIFLQKLDSLRLSKLNRLEVLLEAGRISENSYEMAKSSIDYKSYIYREKYPFWHKRKSKEKNLHSLPSDFYAHREDVTYNNPDLAYLTPYYNFMIYHVGNLAYTNCQQACDTKTGEIKDQLHFNRHQLQVIDSLVPQKDLRDNLFRRVAMDYLLKNDTEANYDVFMEDFHRLSKNNRHLGEISQLSENIKKLRPSKPLPNLTVYDHANQAVNLKKIAKGKEVVFYFWTGVEIRHFRNINARIRSLQGQYPNYEFVGICLRTDKERWKSLVETYGLNPEQQYWAADFDTFAHTLIVYHPYKSIVAKDSLIVNGFANINSSF